MVPDPRSPRPSAAVLAAMLAAALALAACQTPPEAEPATPPAAAASGTPALPEDEAAEPASAADSGDDGRAASGPAAGPDYGAAAPRTRRVALLLPLSGAHAALGRDLLDAATLALFDIGDGRIELAVADTEGAAEGAAAAAERVLAAGPDLIVGPLFSRSVAAAAPVARRAGIGMIALSSDLTVAGPGVYVLGVAPEDRVERVVAHAADRGHLRFAVLAPRTAFGRRMAAALDEAAARHGGAVTARAFHDPDGRGIDDTVRELMAVPARRADLLAQIAELERRGDEASLASVGRLLAAEADGALAFDALLVPESGSLLRRLAAWLGYRDVDPARTRLLGLAGWNDPALLREPVMKGAWFAATPETGRAWFAGRFLDAYGGEPARLATLAYDAMALAAALAGGGEAGDFSARAITDWRGFAGVDGLFRFGADGRPERGLAVMEISADGAVVADPAPARFEPPAGAAPSLD